MSESHSVTPDASRTPWRLRPERTAAVLVAVLAAAIVVSFLVTYDWSGMRAADEAGGELPVLTVPPDTKVAAKGILTTVDLGTASVANADDPAVIVTNNVTGSHSTTARLGFGTTTVLWIATDSSGNTVTATSTVTVDPSYLDTAWQYQMVGGDGAVVATMNPQSLSDIALWSTTSGHGTMHLFKSFPAAELRGRDIVLDVGLETDPYVGAYLRDGGYSRYAASDFTESWPASKGGPALLDREDGHRSDFTESWPASKGGGVLASYERPHLHAAPHDASDLTVVLTPDWSRSQLDEVTLFIEASRPPHGHTLILRSVDITGHSEWIFDGYAVRQGAGSGTVEMLPTEAVHQTRHAMPLNDTFDSSLEGWSYWGTATEYEIGRQSVDGRTAAHVHTEDEIVVYAGMQKTVDVSSLDVSGQRLVLSYDYKAIGATPDSSVTNTRMAILDADSGNWLHRSYLVLGGTTDTGWQTYTTDITGHASGRDAITIVLYMRDIWGTDWDHHNWYDNVRVYAINQTAPVPTHHTYAPPAYGCCSHPGDDWHLPELVCAHQPGSVVCKQPSRR